MEQYESLKIEIVAFESVDIITDSGDPLGPELDA